MTDQATSETPAKRRLNVTLDSFSMFVEPRTRKNRKQLRLSYSCTNGYPNVNLDTDEEDEPDRNNGYLRLSSRLNSTNFGVFMSYIEQATKESAGWRRKIECFHTYKDGKQHESPVHVNDLIVGVDNQGLVYVSILQAGRTSSKFVFGPSEWHNYKDGEGNVISQKEQNTICASETARCLRIAMMAAVAQDAMDSQTSRAGLPSPSTKPVGEDGGYQKKQWSGNSGGGGYQGGGGGYQKKPWTPNNGGGGGGGYQKKPWTPNNGGGGGGYNRPNSGAPNPKPAADTDIEEFDL